VLNKKRGWPYNQGKRTEKKRRKQKKEEKCATSTPEPRRKGLIERKGKEACPRKLPKPKEETPAQDCHMKAKEKRYT